MRINIYSQELTKEVKLVESVARDNGIKHYGIRIYLASPGILNNTPDDDDRSAVTFWIPNCGSFTPMELGDVFSRMADMAYKYGGKIARGEL